MDAILSLHDSRMSDEDMAELRLALSQDIARETGLTARQAEAAGGLGSKGDLVTIGQIALVALGSGGAVAALLQVLKSYVERKPTLRIEIKTPDDRELTITTEHFSPKQIEQTVQAVKQLWPESASPSS